MKQQPLLAICPNTRGFGYALMQDPQTIISYGVVSVTPLCNRRLIKRAKRILDIYEPSLIILENVDDIHSRKGRRTRRFMSRLRALFHKLDITIHSHSREHIKDVFRQFGVTTKFGIAKRLSEWFEELEIDMPAYRKPWQAEQYTMGMFDALSLAITHYYLHD